MPSFAILKLQKQQKKKGKENEILSNNSSDVDFEYGSSAAKKELR